MWRFTIFTCLLIASISSYAQNDTDTLEGVSAPAKLSESVQELSWYLCEGIVSDTVKAKRIYNWITHNIAYDISAAKDPDRLPPELKNILAERKTTAEGYTLLYTEMCRSVGLDAVSIEGYIKSWTVDNGDEFYVIRHEWCAVMLDRRWELVDPTFGAGAIKREANWLQELNPFSKDEVDYSKKEEVFKFKYDPDWFVVDPIEMRHSHLPADPLWQLARQHMPLSVFEQGDSAVTAYNTENSERVSRAPELAYISRLNYRQRIIEFADRAYEFNQRNFDILIRKELLKAADALSRHAPPRSEAPRSVLEDAYRGMVLAELYVDTLNELFPRHYNELRRKNIDKSRAAKEWFRDIKVYNKRQAAQCRRRALSAGRKRELLVSREDRALDKEERISPDKIDSIKTIGIEKSINDPFLKTLSDSINIKQDRIKKSNYSVLEHMQGITLLQDANKNMLDTLKSLYEIADTLLSVELRARMRFRDNYDDIVRSCMANFSRIKYKECDTLLQTYYSNFDTLLNYYEDLQKVYETQIWDYRALLRELEQYRRWNASNEGVPKLYANICQKYIECLSQYKQTIGVFDTYLEKNIKQYDYLSYIYEGELDIVDKMDKAEDGRKNAEEVTIAEQRKYDERILEKREQAVKGYKKQLTDILSQ